MVTGLYASLAASASIFIGILTALLTSNISTHKAERNRIMYRIEAIDARLRELDEKREDLEDVIEDIYLTWVDEQRTEEDHEDTDWYIHEREEYNRNQHEWLQTKTEILSLQRERDKLVDRHDVLDPSGIMESLQAGVVTIFLAVVVPSIGYLARIIGILRYETPLWWIEPVIVFLVWAAGLSYVFCHLREKLNEDLGDIPEKPEIEFTELEEPDELPK